jgi:bifunctional DNA-binding transcriptional regulator/antitoxin component of YhaV-PrlF toxin-antitoxin module
MATTRTSRIVRPLRNGQITIPIDFRRELGITDDTLLRITLDGEELRIRPVQAAEKQKGSAWLRDLYELFAPMREEAAKYSEDEINTIIDEAVKEVRARHAESRG